MRELVYYIATSLDGYIAGPDGELDAFPVVGDHMPVILSEYADTIPAHIASQLELEQDKSLFDTVLMGWNTYQIGVPFGVTSPYPHLRQFVFSRQPHTAADAGSGVEVTGEDPRAVVRRLKAEPTGSAIWLCGGGQLASVLADDIDRLVLKVNPVLLGRGIPLFGSGSYAPRGFALTRSRPFESGVVINEYERSRDAAGDHVDV